MHVGCKKIIERRSSCAHGIANAKEANQACCQEVNILQPEDDEEVSAMDCARLRPDGEYLDNSATWMKPCIQARALTITGLARRWIS